MGAQGGGQAGGRPGGASSSPYLSLISFSPAAPLTVLVINRGVQEEEEEEDLGVPSGTARGEKYPTSGSDWWENWGFGLTYNDEEYG